MLKLQNFGHLMWRADSLENNPDAGKDWGQAKRATEDEMVGWHRQLSGHEFEQTLGDTEGQGSLACCRPLFGVAKSWTRLSNWTPPPAWCRTTGPQGGHRWPQGIHNPIGGGALNGRKSIKQHQSITHPLKKYFSAYSVPSIILGTWHIFSPNLCTLWCRTLVKSYPSSQPSPPISLLPPANPCG